MGTIQLIDTQTAAVRAGVHYQTIKAWARSGHLKAAMNLKGRGYLFDPQAVDAAAANPPKRGKPPLIHK